jgi:DNA-binding response OmpR family regulator
MDINMPDMDGITATQIINQQVVTSKVIILSVQDDKDQMHRALEAGAREYLTKPITPEELTDSIRFVCNPPSATIATKQDAIPTTPSHPQSPKPDPLSPESIFISYKRTDWDTYVGPLVERLRTAGLSIWVDQHRLVTGKDWFDQINLALTTCERMILCVSPDALQSRHVKVEYRYFFNKGKPLYPLICRPTELPPELFSLQYYEYTHIEQLIALLKADSRH